MNKNLKLGPSAFNEELLKLVGTNKIGWSAEDHSKLVDAVKSHLKDENGEPLKLDEHASDIVSLIFRPAEDLQLKVLKRTLERAGYQLDASAENALALLFNQGRFADHLATNTNPKTGAKFITKEKRGKKANVFTSLVGTGSPTAASTSGNAKAEASPSGIESAGN